MWLGKETNLDEVGPGGVLKERLIWQLGDCPERHWQTDPVQASRGDVGKVL